MGRYGKDQTYIIGHWNYPDNTVKPVQVVSTGEEVELFLNGNSLGKGKRQYNFLFTFDNVAFKPGKLEAVSYNKAGKEISRYAVNTAGEPASLKLTAIQTRRLSCRRCGYDIDTGGSGR